MRLSTFIVLAVISYGDIARAECVLMDQGRCLEEADLGRCLLEVGGKKYLDGMCNIMTSEDGSISIGVGTEGRRNASKFFAYVNKNEDGTAEGTWNGIQAESHAQQRLGTLRQEGDACWVNSTSKVCGWR